MSGYALWNPFTNYLKDNRVWYEKSVYTAIIPNQKKDPILNPDIWEEEKRLSINEEGQLTLGSGQSEVLDIDTIAQRIFDRIILLVDDKMPIRSVIGKALSDLLGVKSRVDVVDTSLVAVDASLSHHDASLALVDASLTHHDASLAVVDASLGAFAVIDSALEAKDLIHDISLTVAEAKQLLTDVSLGLVDARLATTELMDAAAESSIAGLDARISAIEISSDTSALALRLDAVDVSLAAVDVSLGSKADLALVDASLAVLDASLNTKEDKGLMHKLEVEDITTVGISAAYWGESIQNAIALAMDAGKIASYAFDAPASEIALPLGSPVAGSVRRLRNAHAEAVLPVSLGGVSYELVPSETVTFQYDGSVWRLL